jgi:hypothetical protein
MSKFPPSQGAGTSPFYKIRELKNKKYVKMTTFIKMLSLVWPHSQSVGKIRNAKKLYFLTKLLKLCVLATKQKVY